MRAASTALSLLLIALCLPASAVDPAEVFVAEGRIPLPAEAPLTAVAVTGDSIYTAEAGGEQICEYTLVGNLKRCLDRLPTDLGPLEIRSIAYRPPEPAISKAGILYVAATGHQRIYKVDLHSGRVDKDYVRLNARSLTNAEYGLLVGRPVSTAHRTDPQAFHRLSRDLRSSWSFEPVDDEVLLESPWAPLAVGPDGDVYGAVSGRYEIVRYDPRGYAKTSFGVPGPVFEDVVPKGDLSEEEWLKLWSPVYRLDRVDDSLVVTSRVHRSDRAWDVLDVYSLDGEPQVRAIALENEFPVASTEHNLYTVRRDEPGVVLYRWSVQVPEDLPEGGLIAALPPALSPVRAASGLGGDVDWTLLRPYLEAAFGVVDVKRSRPVVKFSSNAMARNVPGYLEPIGRSVSEALGRLLGDEVGETLRREFLRATFAGAGAETATSLGWDHVFEDPVLMTRLRGELCQELRLRGYPCP